MAEAEDVITDAARHATVFARRLWLRHSHSPNVPSVIKLDCFADRLALLISAVFGVHYAIRIAQPAAARTFLASLLRRGDLPIPATAIPATDDNALWLPVDLNSSQFQESLTKYRSMALQQAMRAHRRSAQARNTLTSPLERDTYLVLEACASDAALVRLLPGLADSIHELRSETLAARPPLNSIAPWHRPLETLLRSILVSKCDAPPPYIADCVTANQSAVLAKRMAPQLAPIALTSSKWGAVAIVKDYWTGDLLEPAAQATTFNPLGNNPDAVSFKPPRSAKLSRRPNVRRAAEDEDDEKQGAWMVQPSQPIEHAEDPMGMQRPTDRDDQTPADEFADSLSELAEARLVSTPDRPKDVLLSDDPPETHATLLPRSSQAVTSRLQYPEWDYRTAAYIKPGATVHLLAPKSGPLEWVEQTLEKHRYMLDVIRRRFDMLRPERTRLRKQMDGDGIDLAAYVDAMADKHAGQPVKQMLYESHRSGRRDMAIVLLIDISGSTDSWLSSTQRVIDVEREALLLVCTALERLQEPYSIQAFSGEGQQGVTVSAIKDFNEPYDMQIAQRIAALEPENYTRAGAAIRHATMLLMKAPAQHRLLLLLSDGKPNDADDYEGRYGIEDMRQSVMEAKQQGIFPFCLTIDRQAAHYLPAVFGLRQYALLPKAEVLPTVLLDWMRRLLSR